MIDQGVQRSLPAPTRRLHSTREDTMWTLSSEIGINHRSVLWIMEFPSVLLKLEEPGKSGEQIALL